MGKLEDIAVMSRAHTARLLIVLTLVCPLSRELSAAEVTSAERNTALILLATGVTATVALKPPPEPRWTGPVLFDSVGEGWRAQDPATGRLHRSASDVGLVSLIGAGIGVSVGKNAAVGWRAAMAYGSVISLTQLTKPIFARERPYGSQCATGGAVGLPCESWETRASFFSGHAALSYASASLVCLEYPGVACAGALTAATTVAYLRVSGSMHWLSDVVVGAAVGVAGGYLLPRSVGTSPREARLAPAWFSFGFSY